MLDTTERFPLIRFAKDAVEDRIATEQSGRLQYMDVIYVYVRAPGDAKCEFKDVAQKTAYDHHTAREMVKKPRTVWNKETGEQETKEVEVEEDVPYYTPKTVTPWLDKIEQQLHHKKCSEAYRNYCRDAFERFKRDEEQPINGTPLAMWSGAPLHIVKRAIECGIRSIEDAAEMSTEAMGAIGMGASQLKNLARAYVEQDKQPEETARKMTEQDNKIQEQAEQLSALEAKIAELTQPKRTGKAK